MAIGQSNHPWEKQNGLSVSEHCTDWMLRQMPFLNLLKITTKTHELLKKYCEDNGLKMFAYVETLIKDKCIPKKDFYDED